MSDVPPRSLEGSDLTEVIRYVRGHVKAPAIGDLLAAAGCLDPTPDAGKRGRLRNAVEATQRRDGHGEAVVRLMELVAAAEDAERRRSKALRTAQQAALYTEPRATVRAAGGFRIQVGVTGSAPELAVTLTILPDLSGTPVPLTLDQARELYRELAEVGREVARRIEQAA